MGYRNAKNRRAVAFGTTGRLVPISGDSMRPVLTDGARVLVDTERQARLGDIIVFLSNQGMVAHRIMRVINGADGTRYVTKGDASPRFDPMPVYRSDVIGVVSGVMRGGRAHPLGGALKRGTGMAVSVMSYYAGRLKKDKHGGFKRDG